MQARYGARPDLTAMGKIIGGGLPVGALAGRNEVMDVFSSAGGGPRLPQSGTFSANPLTITAGAAAMELFDAAAVERLNRLGARARRRIEEAIAVSGAPVSVTGTGSMLRVHMKPEAPVDYRTSYPTAAEKRALRRFVNGLYNAGIVATTPAPWCCRRRWARPKSIVSGRPCCRACVARQDRIATPMAKSNLERHPADR